MTANEESVDATAVTPGAGSEPTHQGRLDQIAARPLTEHPDGYEQLHAELRTALAEIDDA